MTKQDLQEAFTAVMWAYYWKKEQAQYDSLLFTSLDYPDGGAFRNTTQVPPEYGTKDTCIYAVCSSYPYMAYYNTFLVGGKPFRWMRGRDPNATDYLTYTMWESGLAETTVLRWAQRLEPEDLVWCRENGWQEQKSFTSFSGMDNRALARWFRENWRTFLEPGDMLVMFTPRGHVATYMGAGMVLEAKGKKWADGREAYEPEGCFDLYDIEDYFVNGSAFASEDQRYRIDRVKELDDDGNPVYALERFLVMRPMNLLLDAAGNVRPEVSIDPSARERVRHPGLEIDRTVSCTPFGTVPTGGEVRVSVTLTNHVFDPFQGVYHDRGQTPVSFPSWYASFYGAPAGADRTNWELPVKERIPAGTALVPGSASPEAECKDGSLFWRVTLAPGERRSVSYALRVLAQRGSRIVSDRGSVGQIPSNRLEITVGGKKPVLAGLPEHAHALTGTGLAFAESVLRRLFSLRPELPDEQTLFDAFFEPATEGNSHAKAASAGLFVPRRRIPAQLARFAAMRVRRYQGGRMIHTEHQSMDRMYEFRTAYLEPGDILLKGMLENGRVVSAQAPVYLGGGRFACEADGGMQISTDERVMWDAFGYDFFFTLRLSQAYDDVYTEIAEKP